MRCYLKLSRNERSLPFNYQQYLTGAIHKWLGNNDEHGKLSLYSFSWIKNLQQTTTGFNLTATSSFFFSAHEETLVRQLLKGVAADPAVCFGSQVTAVDIVSGRQFSSQEKLWVASPVFIKRKAINEKVKHFTYEHPESSQYLTETLQKKLQVAGLDHTGVAVRFDDHFSGSKTKISTYRDIHNKVSICPVIINGSPEQIAFAWNVGLGNSTGIGYGALS
ncbi:CRISPR-associated endoribonuclease Cas6 [Chitinophaga nivalis]|uniref:CRISPR-associated endoribonuclease Cas6 n=1 Tax=Chitinophaga nivalis TaxID=2991709 RepID=A0ABT3IPN6_9BACT|nr:CRISPR-associated endoribonuclease Cas6 [Chitinophaga nivalis]MCW3464397.1 CRISPR-associated endoribonuclease Cas6 [Chitinophaga nivalis]MCW3485912.1 CRISPR-associated endoribonuclease Cas6 [Chitinophaga nivalis]